MSILSTILKWRNKAWKFTFTSAEKGTYTFKYNPLEWQETEYALVREDEGGIMFTFSGEYTYLKDAYSYLKDGLDTYGILWNCYLTIEHLDNFTQQYETFVSLKKLDFSSQNEDDSTSGLTFKIPLTDSGFYENIKTYEDVEIPYSRLETLSGATITPFANEYEDVTVYGVELLSTNVITIQDSGSISQQIIFPSISSVSQDPAWISTIKQDADGILAGNEAPNEQWILDRMFFNPVKRQGTLSGTINVKYSSFASGNNSFHIYDYKTTVPIDVSSVIDFWPGIGAPAQTVNLTFSYDFDQDTRLVLYCGSAVGFGQIYEIDSGELTLIDKRNPDVLQHVSVMQLHKRLIEAMTDQADSFVASVFDTGGKWEHLYFSNGYLYRQFTTDEAQLTFKWKELQDNMRKMLNVEYGMIVEGGVKKIICEDKSYFYNNTVGHILTDIKRNSFIRERDINLFYSSIAVGTPKLDYEESGALKSYANLCNYSTCLGRFKNELDLVTSYYIDPIMLETVRRLPKTATETTDSQYDNKIIILETIDSGGLIQRTTEDFDIVSGIDEISTPMNLNLPPARCLYRHGSWIGIGLQKNLDKLIKFNKSEILNTLSTVRSDESITVSENVDIDPNDLEVPYLTGFKIKVLADVTMQKISLIEADPYKTIQLPNTIDGGNSQIFLNSISNKPIGESLSNLEGYESGVATIPTAKYWKWLDGNNIEWVTGDGIELLQ